MVAKHRKMDQHIALALLADEKAEAASRVEPFDPACDMEAVAIVVRAIVVSIAVGGAGGIVAFAIFIARVQDGMRNNGLSISRRTGDRRRTLH